MKNSITSQRTAQPIPFIPSYPILAQRSTPRCVSLEGSFTPDPARHGIRYGATRRRIHTECGAVRCRAATCPVRKGLKSV